MDKKSANVMLDGLIGQANLEYARGNKEEAITLLQEVCYIIRYSALLRSSLGYSSGPKKR